MWVLMNKHFFSDSCVHRAHEGLNIFSSMFLESITIRGWVLNQRDAANFFTNAAGVISWTGLNIAKNEWNPLSMLSVWQNVKMFSRYLRLKERGYRWPFWFPFFQMRMAGMMPYNLQLEWKLIFNVFVLDRMSSINESAYVPQWCHTMYNWSNSFYFYYSVELNLYLINSFWNNKTMSVTYWHLCCFYFIQLLISNRTVILCTISQGCSIQTEASLSLPLCIILFSIICPMQ